jgi:hypothetical protein
MSLMHASRFLTVFNSSSELITVIVSIVSKSELQSSS